VPSLQIHRNAPRCFGRGICQSRQYCRLSQAEYAFLILLQTEHRSALFRRIWTWEFRFVLTAEYPICNDYFCAMKRIFIARPFALFSPFGSFYRREVAKNLVFSAVIALKRKFFGRLSAEMRILG
jgi:hypothetical protein